MGWASTDHSDGDKHLKLKAAQPTPEADHPIPTMNKVGTERVRVYKHARACKVARLRTKPPVGPCSTETPNAMTASMVTLGER